MVGRDDHTAPGIVERILTGDEQAGDQPGQAPHEPAGGLEGAGVGVSASDVPHDAVNAAAKDRCFNSSLTRRSRYTGG